MGGRKCPPTLPPNMRAGRRVRGQAQTNGGGRPLAVDFRVPVIGLLGIRVRDELGRALVPVSGLDGFRVGDARGRALVPVGRLRQEDKKGGGRVVGWGGRPCCIR